MLFEYGVFLIQFLVKILIHRVLKTDLERELFVVLKENEILKRKLHRRVPITPVDRAFYVGLYRSSKNLLKRIVIIQPETILAWHRKLVEKKWNSFGQIRRGRPKISDEIREIVLRMKKANPRWGANRIAMEVNKMRLLVCKGSVAKILREHGFDPTRSTGIGWFKFIKSQATFACDYFEVETLFLKRLNVFFMIDIQTRAIVSFAVTKDRSQEWVRTHMRSIFSFIDQLPTVLVCDRDTSFGGELGSFLSENYGIRLLKIPRRMPVFNCFAERMVRTFREELTDHLLFYGERDMSRALREFVDYYNHHRIHSSLKCSAPKKDFSWQGHQLTSPLIRENKILGGLITDFDLAA